MTQYILKERNAENIPTEVTFRRYAKWYKANNLDKWTLARDGMKALKDKVEPYIVRDTSMLEVGQVLVADGHTLNFQVINPFTGKPSRATLIGFLDWKSGGLVGYDIMLEENTQNIASALRNAILTMDKIPEYVYQDNGRAFKSKFFNGDSKFEELGFTGVYKKLGITPVYATPYNARAKVIERFFLDFQESFEKLMPSYIGTSIDNKPAYMNRNEKLHKQIHEQKANFVPTIEQALILVREWLKFKHSQPCPNNRSRKGVKKMEFVEPIRDKRKIELVKVILKENGFRDYMLFLMGINSGLRISDILKLKVSDVRGKRYIEVKEQKTGKYRKFPITESFKAPLKEYITEKSSDEWLFCSQRGENAITRVQAYRIISQACEKAGITSRIGTHTLRKTFGYHFYKEKKDIALLQSILNHSSPSVTLRYIGINQDIIDKNLNTFKL